MTSLYSSDAQEEELTKKMASGRTQLPQVFGDIYKKLANRREKNSKKTNS